MRTLADVINEYATTRGTSQLETTGRTLFVPDVYQYGQIIHGVFDSSRTDPIGRYGKGFGTPNRRDPNVPPPAIAVIPDEFNALAGYGVSEATELPNDIALHAFGLPYLTNQDITDLRACYRFQIEVVCCVNRGLPLGTPRENWPQPVNAFVPFPPTTVKTPLDPPQPNSTVAANASIDIPGLISQTLNQLLPALITAEIARALPKQTITDPVPIPAVIVAPPAQQNSTSVAVLAQISDLINSLTFPAGNAGGAAWAALRKIRKLLPQ